MARLHRDLHRAALEYRTLHEQDPYFEDPSTHDAVAKCENEMFELLARIDEEPTPDDTS
jgi:hypothetical protein